MLPEMMTFYSKSVPYFYGSIDGLLILSTGCLQLLEILEISWNLFDTTGKIYD